MWVVATAKTIPLIEWESEYKPSRTPKPRGRGQGVVQRKLSQNDSQNGSWSTELTTSHQRKGQGIPSGFLQNGVLNLLPPPDHLLPGFTAYDAGSLL